MVEYLVVFSGFLAMILSLGVISHFLNEGTILQHALAFASHTVVGVGIGVVNDVFIF